MTSATLLISLLNSLVWFSIPLYCLYLYITKKLKGALVVSIGFFVDALLSMFAPILLGHQINPEFFRDSMMVLSFFNSLAFASFVVYGLHLLVKDK